MACSRYHVYYGFVNRMLDEVDISFKINPPPHSKYPCHLQINEFILKRNKQMICE